MVFKLTNSRKPRAGFTLVELIVGIALGTLVLVAVASIYLFSLTSYASLANYAELNAKDRMASDTISRDIRSASAVASVTASQLVLRFGKADVTYAYDPDLGTLTRWQFGESRVLLKNVDDLSFYLYQRPLTNSAYEQFLAATPTTAKMVAFEWSCSQRVYLSVKSSSSHQAAIVELRNK
jgi:prepilin-type N-terminal cleavage/methylation domain-containing protein